MLDKDQIAKRLGVAPETIKIWRRAGLLRAHAYNDKGQYLYEPPGKDRPIKYKHKARPLRRTAKAQPTTSAASHR